MAIHVEDMRITGDCRHSPRRKLAFRSPLWMEKPNRTGVAEGSFVEVCSVTHAVLALHETGRLCSVPRKTKELRMDAGPERVFSQVLPD